MSLNSRLPDFCMTISYCSVHLGFAHDEEALFEGHYHNAINSDPQRHSRPSSELIRRAMQALCQRHADDGLSPSVDSAIVAPPFCPMMRRPISDPRAERSQG
jgi:hypothetical protein